MGRPRKIKIDPDLSDPDYHAAAEELGAALPDSGPIARSKRVAAKAPNKRRAPARPEETHDVQRWGNILVPGAGYAFRDVDGNVKTSKGG